MRLFFWGLFSGIVLSVAVCALLPLRWQAEWEMAADRLQDKHIIVIGYNPKIKMLAESFSRTHQEPEPNDFCVISYREKHRAKNAIKKALLEAWSQ